MKEPVFFIGHGSPMNAIADNAYTRKLAELGAGPKPRAVLCVSAHWMTRGTTAVTAMAKPRSIHDFGGFPQALFDVQYPAPGEPAVAAEVAQLIPGVRMDQAWGLDHGTWSVLRHVYPQADVPVLQISLDMLKPPLEHLALGRALRPLRDRGVRIVASGNVVHNLRQIKWEENADPFAWSVEFDAWMRERLDAGEYEKIATEFGQAPGGPQSVPTLDHYLPLLYAIGAADPGEKPHVEFSGQQNASISMLSFSYGRNA